MAALVVRVRRCQLPTAIDKLAMETVFPISPLIFQRTYSSPAPFSGIDSSMCSLMRKYQLQYTLSVVFEQPSSKLPPPYFFSQLFPFSLRFLWQFVTELQSL